MNVPGGIVALLQTHPDLRRKIFRSAEGSLGSTPGSSVGLDRGASVLSSGNKVDQYIVTEFPEYAAGPRVAISALLQLVANLAR
jgi:hypothetical protein